MCNWLRRSYFEAIKNALLCYVVINKQLIELVISVAAIPHTTYNTGTSN